jgi:PAS domain S-box-containing protein
MLQNFIGRFRLRTLLTVTIVIVFIIAIGITGVLSFLNSQYAVTKLSDQLQNEISGRIEQHLDSYLKTPHLINQLCLDSIRLGEISASDPEQLARHFQVLSYRYGSLESLFYANEQEGNYTIIASVGAPGIANGTERFSGRSLKTTNFSFDEYKIDRSGEILEKTYHIPHYDPRTRPWYLAAVQAEGPVWTPIYMWIEGVVSQDAVVPVYSEQNRLIGVLGSSQTLAGISDFLQNLNISRTGQAFIIERTGLLVASSTMKEPYTKQNGELIRLSALNSNNSVIQDTARYLMSDTRYLKNISSKERISFEINGERQFVQITPYHDTYGLDWLIVVVIPESDFMSEVVRNNRTTIILIIGAIFGTTIICILLATWITGPIVSMNRSARALANGDWRSWEELDRHDELGELSQSFRYMADQLRAVFSSLKSSEERYMSLFQSSADPILLLDRYTLININQAGEKMLGISAGEAKGKGVRELFGKEGEIISGMIASSLSARDDTYRETTLSQTLAGSERFMNIRLKQINQEEESLILLHIRDVTEERRAILLEAEQKALLESYSHAQMILQLLPDPTFVIDKEGRIIVWNRALEGITGKSPEQMIGKAGYEYSLALFGDSHPILIDYALHPELLENGQYPSIKRSGNTLKSDMWLKKGDQSRFCSVIAACIYDRDGNVSGAVESIRDITSLKATEEALIVANKKQNLLASITRHDILNKIMIVKGHLYLLGESETDHEMLDSLDAINRSIVDIEQFIAFTKIYQEIGMKRPVWQDVREVFSNAASQVQTGDVAVNIRVSGVSILADPLLEKVCYNLFENAIRHGGTLTTIEVTAGEKDGTLIIAVQDDGIGVPDNQKELIFERGFGKNSGLGLFLSQEILSLSGITLAEKGVYGSFCRFEITVPDGKYSFE